MSGAFDVISSVSLLLATTALMACSSDESKVRSEYVAECTQSGVDRAVCDCTYDKMLKFYTSKELKAMSQSSRKMPADFMDNVVRAVLICKKELDR